MVVLSNTSPLIYLSKMGELNLLKSLFSEVVVAIRFLRKSWYKERENLEPAKCKAPIGSNASPSPIRMPYKNCATTICWMLVQPRP
jgi:hypothetical protein